jgi:hypothetical protein
MNKNLGDAITEVSAARMTGVLSVSIKNDNNQLKFFFREGTVYHVTYSSCRNLECLVRLGALEVERGFFILGAKMEVAHPITIRTEDIITKVKDLNKIIAWSDSAVSSSSEGSGVALASGSDLARLEEELLTMLGPVGGIILDRALQECGVQKGGAIPKQTFHSLVQTISRQIPEEHQNKILALFAF